MAKILSMPAGGGSLKSLIKIIKNGVLQIANTITDGSSVQNSGYVTVSGAGYYTEIIDTENCDTLTVDAMNTGTSGTRQVGYRVMSNPSVFIPCFSVSGVTRTTVSITVPKNTLVQIGFNTGSPSYTTNVFDITLLEA